MKTYIHILLTVLAWIICISCIFIVSCQSPVVPIEADNPTIIYEVSGGVMGDYFKLIIDNTGLASYVSVYPVLQMQLPEEEFTNIKSYLKNFDNYQPSYLDSCIDDFRHKLTLQTNTRQKTVEFDGCSIDRNPNLEPLKELVILFGKVRDSIYNEKAAWVGLTYQFSMDSTSYSQSDSINFFCKIINQTTKERIIYFKNKYRIQVAIHNDITNPEISFRTPDNSISSSDTTSPSEIILEPGEVKTITYSWDQSFVNYDMVSYKSLPYGKYNATIYLQGGIYPVSNYLSFQIK
ncbi:MAG: hypothetical protein M1480_18895 [Bacteroidetes bacterium]|nr:hypothetical protein [Bacteroidota bacterium]